VKQKIESSLAHWSAADERLQSDGLAKLQTCFDWLEKQGQDRGLVDQAAWRAYCETVEYGASKSQSSRKEDADYTFKNDAQAREFVEKSRKCLLEDLFPITKECSRRINNLSTELGTRLSNRAKDIVSQSGGNALRLLNIEEELNFGEMGNVVADNLIEHRSGLVSDVVMGYFTVAFLPLVLVSSTVRKMGSKLFTKIGLQRSSIDKATFTKAMQEKVIQPQIDALKERAKPALEKTLLKYSRSAKEAVGKALQAAEASFEAERQRKGDPPSDGEVCAAVALLSDTVAAHAGLTKLQEYLVETKWERGVLAKQA